MGDNSYKMSKYQLDPTWQSCALMSLTFCKRFQINIFNGEKGVVATRKGKKLERDLDLWPCNQNEGQRPRGPMPKFQVIISYGSWVSVVYVK